MRIGNSLGIRRFLWRMARSPGATVGWLRTLEWLREATGVATIPFNLVRKPGRHFLHHQLSYPTKVGLLTAHYQRLLATVGPSATGRLLEGQPFTIAAFQGKSTAYNLILARNVRFCREGEIILDLKRADEDQPIATLSLVLGALSPGEPVDLWIGGLQGCKGDDSKRVTVATTRDLWDLRPKDLMVAVAYQLKDILGASSLKAISNTGHIVMRPCAKVKKRIADYDAYWLELGGAAVHDDFFSLPPERRIRLETDVLPAKRKAWRARRALIADVEAQMSNFLLADVSGPIA